MTDELVSIILPCYNAEKYISHAIESVLEQTYSNWELIIVDDGSTDGSVLIAKSFQNINENIVVFPKDNTGAADSRNIGMKLASGRYVAFLDADDMWHEDYLEVMLKNIDECPYPNAAIFYCGYRRMDSLCREPVLEDYSCPGLKTKHTLFFHNPIFPSATIVDLARIPENVFFRTDYRNLRDDYAFFLDVLDQGLLAMGYPDILVDDRLHYDSAKANKKAMIRPQWNVYRNVLHLNIFQSIFYMTTWAINGMRKYSK